MDQSEQLRQRLEARKNGKPLPPIPKEESAPAFQPIPIPKAPQPAPIAITELRSSGSAQVEVTNINISFWRLVTLMVKIAFASIPAAIIVAFITYAIWAAMMQLVLNRHV